MVRLGSLLAVLVLIVAAPAAADEAKTPVNASMLLSIISSAPVESRDAAYDQSIMDPRPATPQRGFVLQPDGSLRYGAESSSLNVTVKNPCPPGTVHYEPPPLPGRRAKR